MAIINLDFNRWGLLLVSMMAFFACPIVWADFYEKDFAKSPLGPRSSKSPNRALLDSKLRPKAFTIQRRDSDSAAIEASQGEQVLELGVLTNNSSAIATLATLTKSLRSHSSWKLGPITVTGEAPTGQLLERLSRLQAEGATIVAPSSPLFAGIQASPVWVFGTKQGYHLLEGLADPLYYVNSRGEFVSPDSLVVKPTPVSMETEKF